MGQPVDDLHGDSGSEDATDNTVDYDANNPHQGYFAEFYDNKVKRACQVWLRYQLNGVALKNWCMWEESYGVDTAAVVRGRQDAVMLLVRQIASTLNTGLGASKLRKVFAMLPCDLPAVALPEPWFYWSTVLDTQDVEDTITHYFVHPETDACLVWQEGVYVELVTCEEVDLNWPMVRASIALEFQEEVPDAEEDLADLADPA